MWNDIAGTDVALLKSDPRYPNSPSSSNLVTDLFESPTDVAENYGQRMHGYILPPKTGDYTFWLATDDAGELWLSSDENPATQRRIAYVSGWTTPREWTKEPNQSSAPVHLEANRAYYIAALQKEGGGGDNLAVRWLRPDGVDEGPIPATYLLPWGTVFAPPQILQQPTSTTVIEGQLATFTVGADPLSPATVQWQRNGVDFPGATNPTLVYGPASLADDGTRWRALLSNKLGSMLSSDAILTVTADTTPPAVLSVLNLSTTTVRVIFSEPIDPASATRSSNYQLSGGISVSSVAFIDDDRTVLLTTSPALVYGTTYSLTLSNVRDRAGAANLIAPNTTLSFLAAEYVPVDIASSGGGTVIVPGGFDVTGKGADIGGASDQGHFAYQERNGDFDIRVRVASTTITDPWVQAGLMLRESLSPAARFAGVFASSAQLGCFMASRATTNAQAQIAAPVGGFPVNYPRMWLRLRRSGSEISSYGSFDGAAWQQFGSVSLALPSRVLFGMTVSSHSTNAPATAQFREIGTVPNPTVFTYTPTREPLGPSNRRTGLVFSEIMYHPAPRLDGKKVEFIEVYNGESLFVDLTGWRLTGAVQFTFPDGFKLQAGQFAVIAADPTAVESVYGLHGVLGPYSGQLNNSGESLRLLNRPGAVRLEVHYSPESPWPIAADGHGHSLVLTRPSYGENDPRAWGISELRGGSPGEVDAFAFNPWAGVVINEFLAHTDDPVLDFIELYNHSSASVDLSGCFLSDDPSTNKFRIPNGTTLPAGGFISFDQRQLGFALSAAGETIYLLSADQTRVLDAIRFGGQENGVSAGRSPDGAPEVRRLSARTPGAANAPRRVEEVVINEIMYHPISRQDADQYVELHNLSGRSVDLSGWRLSAGISYHFPAGAAIPPGGYVVVAKDAARLRTNYTQLTLANTFGDFSGSLSKSGERLELTKPDTIVSTNATGLLATNLIHIAVSEVTYHDSGRWPELADGGGSSLELIDARADTLQAASWAASDETQKAPWTAVEYTGRVDLGNTTYSNNRLQITMQGAGECLVDEVEVFRAGSTNLLANGGFENGVTTWSFFGNHKGSALENAGAYAGQSCLHVRALGDGDTANNSIRAALTATVAANQTATIRAKIRWLSGWPEVLFRLRGNWIELAARADVPANLGTPGLPNSRRVANAGPAIFDVTHTPPLPRANQPVVVTCRVSDPDGVAAPRLRFRLDPATTLATLTMRDDGAGGDALAGDGIYSATIASRAAGTLIAFRIEASDDSPTPASTVFPPEAPARECLIRWDDPAPFGTFAHYHMWDTAATEQVFNSSKPLDNTYRDCTLVYGTSRIVYNAGFRNKGSPYHGGSGDYAVTVPGDALLLGSQDRVFGSTGNGASESTGMRGDVSAWIGHELGIPYLHSHYMRLYRNGSRFRDVLYDLEQPNPDLAQDWFGGGHAGDDLFKIAVWFEFADDNSGFGATSATLERFLSEGNFKLARYRWNWQIRPSAGTANNYQSIINLVTAANNSTNRVTGLMNLADMDEWMRVFAYHRVLGNWDSWTFNVGQNMYLYSPLGARSVLIPWDIDFVLGDGNGATDGLSGGQDPIANQLYNVPTYRRMLWRAYQDAVNGPMLPEQYAPQVDARRTILLKNGFTGLADPRAIKTYIEARRNYLQIQIKNNDTKPFALTSNAGADFATDQSPATLTGTAPFAVADIEINGIPYPVTWTSVTAWRIDVPLGSATNKLQIVGRDRRGQPVAGANLAVTVIYSGAVPQPQDWVVINEVMYNAPVKNAEFIELYNRHPSTPFDLSGMQLSGVGFTFPAGSFIPANNYAVIASDRGAFAAAYGAQIPVIGEFPGKLSNGGETLRLVKPDLAGGPDLIIDDLRYDSVPPWPLTADGFGPSLQLIDPSQDNWRPGNWMAPAVDSADRATPGRANATTASLEPFPALWINEVLPSNLTGLVDNQGQHQPWIELFNAGSSPLDLSAYYLSADPANLAQWSFPAGASLAAGQFLLLWADGQVGQSIPSALHTSFRLNSTNGIVLLSRPQLGAPAVMDSLVYSVSAADRSFGSLPDGEPRKRRLMLAPTPGVANNPASPPVQVFVNEWMASNRSTLADPADGQFDDWFELYNAGSTPVDLSSYYLTANLTDKTQFRIPDGTVIAAHGFLLFWADATPAQTLPGGDVHTNFKLPADGGQIGLYGVDGALIDGVTYGVENPDISEGRFPDGAEAPFFFLTKPSPKAPNDAQSADRPPVLAPIADVILVQGQSLDIQVSASDPDLPAQTLTFDLVDGPQGVFVNPLSGQLIWRPGAGQGAGVYSITVRVTDNAVPSRSASRTFKVTIQEVNRAPGLAPIANASVDEGVLLSFRATAVDPNVPAQKLTFALALGAPAGSSIDPTTGEFTWTPTEEQGPGTYLLTIIVTDSGQPPLSSQQSFSVVVREINNPPVITQVGPQNVDELATLRVQIDARDPENPPAQLSYSLENSPSAVHIDANTGLVTWTPTEADGPRDYNITVRVSKPGDSPSATMSFLVGVNEINTAPLLDPIPRMVAAPGDLVTFTNRASDQDLPQQNLSFGPVVPLPAGAALDAVTGLFTWPLGPDPVSGTNLITIRVTDDGKPPLWADQTVAIIVQAPPRVGINEILHRPTTPGSAFIELANYSASNPVDLSGWRLEGYNYLFPAGTVIDPGGYLCVARDLTAFRAAFGLQLRAVGNATVVLPAEGGLVRLLKPALAGALPEVADEVLFDLRPPWPAAAASQGASLQLIDRRRDHRRIANWAASLAGATSTTFPGLPMTANWKFWQSSNPPGATWANPDFNDGSWPSGPALLYVETAALPAAKSTALILGSTTYYFRARFNYTGDPTGARLRLNTIIDDGAVVYLNGQEVYRLAMPEGPITQATFSTRTVGDAVTEGPVEVPALGLRTGENVIAVEVHQANSTSSDIVFGASVDVIAVAAVPFTPGAPNSLAADLVAFPPVWLNEVLPNNAVGLTDGAGEHDPWIELFNAGTDSVSLAGWTLSDDYAALGKWPFPASASIPGHGYLLVWADGQIAQSGAGVFHASFRLPATSGSVALSRPQSGGVALFDYLNYSLPTADQSYGSVPDGAPLARALLMNPSPGGPNVAGPSFVPRVEVDRPSSAKFTLRWGSLPGVRYVLQMTPDLAHPNWQTVQEFLGDGSAAAYSDVIAANSQRFYRVLAQ